MLNLTDEQKRLFYTGENFMDYVFYFPDLELGITNETIHQESVTIKEAICEEEEFTLGGCIASSVEFEVSDIIEQELAGLEFIAEILVNLEEDGSYDLSVPMGRFRVDSAAMVDDQDYKKVVGYDALYDASVDVSSWYDDYFNENSSHTVKETRESLLEYLGIPFLIQTLANDDVNVEKTVESTNLTGTSVLKDLCTINGGFGRINRDGLFEIIVPVGLGLFPEDGMGADGNLHPSEDLYPEDHFEYFGMSVDGESIYPEYRTTSYEEYMTMPVTCLNINSTDDDVGVTIGEDLTNPYLITANMFLYGKSADELREIGEEILSKIKGVTYRPNTTTMDGLPYMEVGDVFSLAKNKDSIESYIFSRTLSGIQAMTDCYESKGSYVRTNEVSASEEIQQLKGKALKIQKNVDKFSLSLEDIEEKTESLLEMTASTIVLQVRKDGKVAAMALDASGREANFTLSADNIVFEGNKIDLTSKDLSVLSDNFQVSPEGNVLAKSIEIKGGSIDLQSSYSGSDQIILQHLDYENFGGEIRYYGEGHPEETEVDAVGNGEMYLDLTTGTIYVWTQLTGWIIARTLANDSYSWEVVSVNSVSGLTITHKDNVLLPAEGEDGKYHDALFAKETEFSLDSSGIHARKKTYDTAMGIVRAYEHEGDIVLEENGVDEANSPKYKLVSTDPIYAPNIGNFQTVSVSSSGTVASGESVTLSFSANEVEGAEGYIAVPQTWSWCAVSRLSMSGTEGSVTLLNTSNAAHTLSTTLLIMTK